uniref:DUF4210 domain-containing protein n=1 Tax=Macrostomum lignano TaxID=282301 RepID=A0A1I8G482_9PLAT
MLPVGSGGDSGSKDGSSGGDNERLWRIDAARQMAKKVTFSHESQTPTSSDNLYFIFNFFETITPPPSFRTFQEGFQHVSKVMELHPQFLNGLLLKNVEPFDRFPYLSYSVLHVQPPTSNFIHDPTWVKVIREGHGDNQVHHQGGFSELHTIWMDPNDAGASNRCRRPLSPASAYIVVSCRLLGNAKQLEANWRQWSGAEFILRSLQPRQLSSLRRISFYRRAVSRCSFTHILLAEFTDCAEIYRLRN